MHPSCLLKVKHQVMDTSSCALPTTRGETPLKHWSVVRNPSSDSDCLLPSDPPSEPWAEEKICYHYAVLWLSKMSLQRFIFFFSPQFVLFCPRFLITIHTRAQDGLRHSKVKKTMWKHFVNELNSSKKKLAIQPNWINKWTNPNQPEQWTTKVLN